MKLFCPECDSENLRCLDGYGNEYICKCEDCRKDFSVKVIPFEDED